MTFRFPYGASPPSIQKYCLNYLSIIVEKWEMCSYYHLHFPLCSIKLFQSRLLERRNDKGVSLQSYSATIRPQGWREAMGRQAKGNDKKRKHKKSLTYKKIVSQKFTHYAIV